MKTNSSFKLSKSTKRLLATMPKAQRTAYKRMMIDAEISASVKPSKRSNEKEVD